MKKLITTILLCCMLFSLFACSARPSENEGGMPDVVKGSITFKNYGVMQFEVYPNKAPVSALRFIQLAKEGFYDGIIVHRLIQDFVIQAGAYESGYAERASDGRHIKGEFSNNGFDNPIPHVRGTLSWARPQAMDGASTQFFICTGDAMVKSLDGGYAAFGMITDGFDVMDAINTQETGSIPEMGMNDVPIEEILIESVVIDSDYDFPAPDFID